MPSWNPVQGVSCVPLCLISIADNAIQGVSYVHLLCSILIADNTCMKFHPGCELCAPPLLDFHCWQCHPGSELCAPPLLNFHCWQCLHEIPSSSWVMCAFSAWFPSLTMSAWNPIQLVSRVCPLCLISIADNACMKSHPVCELCVPPLLDFHCWQCLYEISSSMWVMCTSSAWFPLLTMSLWNPIQNVSCVCLLCLISIADNACMKSHPECELWVPPLLDFHYW